MKKFTLIFLLSCMGIQAQETSKKSYSFSLQQAIEYALEYNYQSINSGRDIQSADEKMKEATALGLPQINANVDFQNNFVLQQSVIPAEFFGGNPGEFVEVAFGTKQTMNALASLNQLIFDGSYIVALQASKTYLDFFKKSKIKTDLEIKEMIINSYGNVLLSEESIEILKSNIASVEKTLFETEQTFKNGLTEEENVEQLNIRLTTLKSSLNYSIRLRDIAQNMLKINLGIELEDDLTLTDDLKSLTALNLDLALLDPEFNVFQNIDYNIMTNFVERRNLELKLEKSRYLPSLGASLNYGYNAFGEDFSTFTDGDNWNNYSNLGLNLNIPIFSGLGRNARTQQAKIALDQAKTELSETEKRLKLEYLTTKSKFDFDVEQYFSSKQNLTLAERIEKKQNVKFTEGLSSSFEFTEAQRQLYTAQQDYLQAMVNVINSRAALEKITTKN